MFNQIYRFKLKYNQNTKSSLWSVKFDNFYCILVYSDWNTIQIWLLAGDVWMILLTHRYLKQERWLIGTLMNLSNHSYQYPRQGKNYAMFHHLLLHSLRNSELHGRCFWILFRSSPSSPPRERKMFADWW